MSDKEGVVRERRRCHSNKAPLKPEGVSIAGRRCYGTKTSIGKEGFIRPLFMGAESCEKSESFVATFGRKLRSVTLFFHARYGAMKVLCTGLVEFGGVLVENSKAQVLTADVFQL